MKAHPMLAIVIPFYRINFFKECLDSLKNQTNKNFKVYIGDDASPDSLSELITECFGHLNIKYKRFEENLGGKSLAGHWERCIKLCENEEWIMILGDDDVLGENVVEEFYKALPEFKGKANVIRFASQVVDSAGNPKSKIYKHPKWEKPADSFFRWLNGKTRSSLSEHIFTKKVYQKYNFKDYPLGWHSDDIAWLDFPNGKEIYSINAVVVLVRHSNINITTSSKNLELKNEASLRFQNDLVVEKQNLFAPDQKKHLFLNFEIFKKERKSMGFKDWYLLLIFYFRNGNLLEVFKLVRRFFIHQMKQIQ